MARPVSIVTVTHDTFFFTRLLVEKVREFIGTRAYEIIVVDRGSNDGTREWLARQNDVRVVTVKPDRRGHGHGEAAELGAKHARHDYIALLDSDAHPVDRRWLELTVDRLDRRYRLAGGVFHRPSKSNPRGWYIHPHFMAFLKADLEQTISLRKMQGEDFDTGELATIHLLNSGLDVIGYPLEFCRSFDVGHPHLPTVTAGVFHAWYGTRLSTEAGVVGSETNGRVTHDNYLGPLQARLRKAYQLDY